ncbi:BTB/POZ protein [Phyllosticta capitalensis]
MVDHGERHVAHVVRSLLDSGQYTDATIECNGKIFPVHKAIICSQSAYFSNAFNSSHGFREAVSSTIHLGDTKACVVDSMVTYMYTGRYPHYAPYDTTELLHCVDVYAIAEMYQVQGLKEFATAHFKDCIVFNLTSTIFPKVVKDIYESTVDGSRGLRDAVSNAAARSIRDDDTLNNSKFNKALDEVADFRKDVMKRLAKEQAVTIECPISTCDFQILIKAAALDSGREEICPECQYRSTYSYWHQVED